jgi:hypothetical protein
MEGLEVCIKTPLCDTSAFVAMKKITHDSYQCENEFIAKVSIIN